MRKRCSIPILLFLVFSMSGVIVCSVFSCAVSAPGGGAVVCPVNLSVFSHRFNCPQVQRVFT